MCIKFTLAIIIILLNPERLKNQIYKEGIGENRGALALRARTHLLLISARVCTANSTSNRTLRLMVLRLFSLGRRGTCAGVFIRLYAPSLHCGAVSQ